jgi:hypothetical protein
MAELVKAAVLKQIFPRIDPAIEDTSLQPACVAANGRLRSWVGSEVYEDAVMATPSEPQRANDLKLAGSYLAMSILLASFSTVVRPEGVLISETSDRNDNYTRYFTPTETKARATELFQLAEQIAGPYFLKIPPVTTDTIEEEGGRGGRRRSKKAL